MRDDASFDDIICVVSAISIAVEKEATPAPRVAHLVDLLFNGMRVR
nr:hypothetical protein [Altericroceibacterium endophyticum]